MRIKAQIQADISIEMLITAKIGEKQDLSLTFTTFCLVAKYQADHSVLQYLAFVGAN